MRACTLIKGERRIKEILFGMCVKIKQTFRRKKKDPSFPVLSLN